MLWVTSQSNPLRESWNAQFSANQPRLVVRGSAGLDWQEIVLLEERFSPLPLPPVSVPRPDPRSPATEPQRSAVIASFSERRMRRWNT